MVEDHYTRELLRQARVFVRRALIPFLRRALIPWNPEEALHAETDQGSR